MTGLARAAVSGGSPEALSLAMALAGAGVAVVLIEADAHDAARATDALRRLGASLTVATDPAAAAGADLLVEASGGDTGLRLALLSAMARHAPQALAVSAGAGADLGALQRGLALPVALIDRPGPGVIEVLAGSAPVEAIALRLGARALTVPAFIGARLIAALEDEAEALVFAGSTPWDVDEAAEAIGFAPGPCLAQDARGLDRAAARRRAGAQGHLPVVARMVAEGRLGRKGGVGWYRYPGGGGPVIDPLVEDLAREEAHFARHPTAAIPPAELTRRLTAALTHAARDCEPASLSLVLRAVCGGPVRLATPDEAPIA